MSEKSRERRKAQRQTIPEGAEPLKAHLHLVKNRLWQENVSEELTSQMLEKSVSELRDGYRLAFPIMVCSGACFMGIALVARHDHRTRAIRDVVIAPGSTHLALLLLFATRGQWESDAAKITRLWPEQPDLPGGTVGLSDDEVAACTGQHDAEIGGIS